MSNTTFTQEKFNQLCADLTDVNSNARKLLGRVDGLADEVLAQLNERGAFESNAFDFKEPRDPLGNENPKLSNAIWINTRSLEIFVCIDNTENKNIWLGSKGGSIGRNDVLRRPGQIGFGVGVCPDEYLEKYNLAELTGTTNPYHENFGNYMDRTGSILVWIPKYYVKYTYKPQEPYYGLQIEVSQTQSAGFMLPRCFINGGEELDGIFIDKYMCSNEGQVAVSKRYGKVLSTNSAHNPISAISGQQNYNQYAYTAIKTRGARYSVPHIALYTYLRDLGEAHFQALWNETKGFKERDYSLCAWADLYPYGVRGATYGLTDINDSSIDYQHDGYTYSNQTRCALAASVSDKNLGKISHNGQKCGVMDLTGLSWEMTCGAQQQQTAGQFYWLKESYDICNLNLTTLYQVANYDVFTPALTNSTTARRLGNGANAVFVNSDTIPSRGDLNYIMNQLGLPNSDNAVTNIGEQRFFQAYIYKNAVSYGQFVVGGDCDISVNNSSLFSRSIVNYNVASVFVGFRGCLVPSQS